MGQNRRAKGDISFVWMQSHNQRVKIQ